MNGLERHAVIYAPDRRVRLVVLGRGDGRFVLGAERLLDYSAGDEWNPTTVPFPVDGSVPEALTVDRRLLDGLYGTIEDAARDAELLPADPTKLFGPREAHS